MFSSKILEDFGITGAEALRRGIIIPGKRLCFSGKLIEDRWECTTNGQSYPTQYLAVKAWFAIEQQKAIERENAWNEADLQWFVYQCAWRHVLLDCKSGKVIFDASNREKIIDYLNDHPELKCAKKVIE